MALCHLAVKLTHKPAEMGQDDVDELRWVGPASAFGSLPAGIVDDALAGRVAALVSRAAR